MDYVKLCEALLFAGNQIDQPEYCDEEAEPEIDYCFKHKGILDRDA